MHSSIMLTPRFRVAVLALATLFILAGCGGGGSGGGSGGPTGPAAALGVSVAPGANNPQDYINAASSSAVDIAVTLPPESQATDNVRVTLSDGHGSEASVQGTGQGVDGGGTIVIQMNASGLSDGLINVFVETNGGQAQSEFEGAFTKDTVPPVMPNAVTPLDAQGGAWAWVNIATSPAAVMRASFAGAPADEGTAQLYVRVGPQEVSTTAQPFSTAVFDFSALDLTTLPDGSLDLEVVLVDLAGNSASSMFQTSKDTVAPQAPFLAQVPSGLNNPVNMINAMTASSVAASMVFGPDVEARNVYASITDGVLTATSDPTTVPLAGGLVAVGAINASGFADGPVSVTAVVTDAAGNPTLYTGTQAVKDTVGPIGAQAAMVAGGPTNAASVVNLSSVLSAQIDVSFAPGATGTETASVVLGFAGNTVTSPSINVPAGGGTVSITGVNCTGLGEGLISLTVVVDDGAGNTNSFTGTPALKDTIPPAAPTLARVAGGAQNNADIINIASVGAVAGLVTFPPSATNTETFSFTMSDSSVTITSPTMASPNGGGSVSIPAVNGGGMADGAITVSVMLTDLAQNTSTVMGTTALKDTVAPIAATAANVDAGANNGANVINLASVSAVSVSVTWPPSAPGNESAVVRLTNGTFVSGPVSQTAGGGVAVATGINSSSVTDGTVALSVITTDPAGNVSTFTGTPASKDTVGPTTPVSAGVDAGMGNGPNVINQTNVGSVSISVTWPAGSPGTETAQVTLGGTITVPVAQASGAGTTTVSGIDASSLADGPVSVTVAVADLSGNSGTFVGAMAVKSAAGPISASSVNVPGGGSNPPNWVNLATAGAVTVQVTFPPSAVGTETVALACTDGSTTVNAGPQPVPAGGGTVNFAGLDLSGLADGPLSLTATTTDAMANMATTGSTGVAKDTLLPANPTAAQVPAGVSNPVDMINSLTVLSSNVNVTWPGDAGNETMYVVVTDGVSSQASLPQTLAAGPAVVGFGGIDCTPLADGPVTLSVNITDAAGNPAVFTGTPANKDTVGPSAPTSANVIPTAGNPIDTITAMSAASTGVSVGFGATGSGSDSATVTLSDGSIGVSSGAQAVVPNGSVTYTLNATSLADGPISVSVNVFDPAGNVTVFSGTTATKSTGALMPPTSANVVAGPNNPLGVITLLSVTSVAVDTTVPGQGSGMTVTCSLTDGSATASAPGQAAPPAGGTVSFTGMDCSALSDGPITINITITDALSNSASFGAPAVKDTVGPPLLVDPTTSPTSAASQIVTGQSDPSTPITILGGLATAVGSTVANGRFAMSVPLNVGATNSLTVSAADAYGNTSVLTVDFVSVPLTIVQNPAAPPVVFTDVTGGSGLSDANGAAGGSFQDLDNDGDLDLFVGVTNKVWQNNGFGVFTDVTSSTATPLTAASSATFGDYDNDGYVDLLLVGVGSVQLMHNESKNAGTIKFTDATTASLATASGAMKAGFWADLDQDGFLDFVVTDSDPSGPEVRRNLGNGTYAPLSLFAPASTQMFFGVAADIVADNRPDFIFADASPSFFHRNDGLMAFTDIAGATSNVSIGQTSEAGGVIVADYDNDGDLDVIVGAGGALSPSASCGGCLRANNQLFHNNGTSSFTAQIGGQPLALLAGIEPSDGWEDLCAGDVNNDGMVDLIATSKGATRLFLNQGDLTAADGVWEFLEVSAACGVVSSGMNEHMVQMADIDGDGDLDLFVPNSAGLGTVYRNDVNNRRNLTVLVHGLGTGPGTASADGIGAHVELRDSTGTTILASREISGGRGFGSQDPLRAHFGVTPSQIYTVQVTFPSGAVRTSSNVVPRDAVNQTITVNE